ncbi:MAG: AgmX/PglI C-terminal domain-containing protein, partial [Syntrophaceae bacterium]|nr:AgmX/PglI C-terminal domain-containing protein [Syntrophaceae bacterium]
FKGFDAYDVEPLTVPDILAERPVIVFGKWRGKAKGSIAVSGITGEGGFVETIDVGKVKPSGANAALATLWARHRITLLSDTNRLRASDRRIQEITELGLRYNLLTAYTSFVAVDSEVRNTDGKPASVKQPLPLPQGVSDYAVGGKMMHASAPMAQAAKREALETSADRAPVKEKRPKDEKKHGNTSVVIADVAVSQGISKEDVVRKITEQTAKLESCFAGAKGKLVLRLTVSPDGSVKSVQVLSSTFKNGKAPQCVLDTLKKITMSATQDGKEGRAVVTLSWG